MRIVGALSLVLVLAAGMIGCGDMPLEDSPTPGLTPTPGHTSTPAPVATPTLEPEAATPTATPIPATPTQPPGPILGPDGHPVGWTEDSHSNDVPADYGIVFPADSVQRLDVEIAPDDWQKMLDQMTELAGEFGAGPSMGGGPELDTAACQGKGPGSSCTTTIETVDYTGICTKNPDGGTELVCMPQPPAEALTACVGALPGTECSYTYDGTTVSGACGNMAPGQPLACFPTPEDNGAIDLIDGELITVPSTVRFNDLTWWYVGIKFKGNSSLALPWQLGMMKLPMKLDFDQFEDQYPEINDQRFYGFKHLTLANGFKDDSLIREKVMDEFFRAAGIPAPYAAYYRLYLDVGDGPTYYGLYSMVEIIESDMLKTQLGSSSGNVYKPDGDAAAWTYFDATAFPKENNEKEADWSDIQAAIEALNADRSDAATWRAGLEATLDVPGFIRWLALNTTAVNWDTYGIMPHNYYLYGDPNQNGMLRWIPWDNNESLKMTGGSAPPLTIALNEVTDEWPLIRFLLDDQVYSEEYRRVLQELIDGPFELNAAKARVQADHDLIAPYVVGSQGENPPYSCLSSDQAFNSSADDINSHLQNRTNEANYYLGN